MENDTKKLITIGELALSNYKDELELMNNVDVNKLADMVKFISEHNLNKLMSADVHVKTMIMQDKADLDIKSISQWMDLEDWKKLSPSERRVMLEAATSLHETTKFLKSLRNMLEHIFQMKDDLEVLCDFLENEGV